MSAELQNKERWIHALQTAIRDPKVLLKALDLESTIPKISLEAIKKFPFSVPWNFVKRMKKGDVYDPLLLQVLPLHEEMNTHANYTPDPLNEKKANLLPGLLHKYKSRILLTVTGRCAIQCRYCFRREFDYKVNSLNALNLKKIAAYILEHPEINEVILSGGDPLIAPDSWLASLMESLAQLKQVEILRIHTRLAIVIPERLTVNFIKKFTGSRLKPVLVTHINHPNEIDGQVAKALQRLNKANVTLFNQSVLLKRVNDDPYILIDLSKKLFNINVLPYYIHLLDKVNGTAHFNVSETRAKEIWKQISFELPGYLVPKLVREVAGYSAKFPII